MPTHQKRIFVFAGEPSGDLHGSHLVRAIKEQHSKIILEGVAGPLMRAEGVHGSLAMEDFEVMGFSDVIRALPRLYRQFYQVRKSILSQSPDAVILIDYPGFNLRMAHSLRKKGYAGKIIQYISPSVWAWGSYRIETMVKTLDLLMTIYPFESQCFEETPLNVRYVGSPVKEQVGRHTYSNGWQQHLGIPQNQPLVALFPGSRSTEIARNLPLILEAASLLKQDHPEALFGISCQEKEKTLLQNALSSFKNLQQCTFTVPRDHTLELMRDCRCAVAKSGTVTLELALHHCPTVSVYQLTRLNRWYAKYILKTNLPHYCIVNILAQKEVFPELIKSGLTSQNLYHHLKTLYQDTHKRKECIQACQEINRSIGTNQASTHAAQAVLELLAC